MKTHQNTLYVTTQKSYLAREGEAVVVRVDRKPRLRVPVHNLGGIVCFGVVSCSPALMALCAENGVAISFLSMHGRFLARVVGSVSGNVLLRRTQYRRADDDGESARLARAFVAGKVANCRTALLRAAREHTDSNATDRIRQGAKRLAASLNALASATALDVVRGIEGDAAHAYFSVFDDLILAQKDAFFFRKRSRRPPLDAMNALLSFLYTLLMHDVRSALEAVGLDPAVGFLHRDRPGRPGLALDLVEEWRAVLADRLALTLVNRRQVAGRGFTKAETGAVSMDDATRKTVLVAWQGRKATELLHPFLEERMTLGLAVHVQAKLLARHLRGDLDAYPPFVWK